MSQDINHRHELNRLSDKQLREALFNLNADLRGSNGNAHTYYIKRKINRTSMGGDSINNIIRILDNLKASREGLISPLGAWLESA